MLDAPVIVWGQAGWYAFYIGLAFLLTLPVAIDRERSHHLGLRTLPLVAVATCAFVILARTQFASTEAEARVVQGILTGIGFIGGGAILKSHGKVHGTSTAATTWCSAGIGVVCAYEQLVLGGLLAIANFAILTLLKPVKDGVHDDEDPSLG